VIGPPADVAGQNRATQAIQAQADDTAQARTNKRWTPRRVRKVVTADAIPLALRIIRSSPSARGQRSPLIQVSHRTTFGKLWCVDSFAALLVEWTYSERALFLRRSGARLSAPRQNLWVLRRAASALAVAVLKVGGLIPARGGLTAHRCRPVTSRSPRSSAHRYLRARRSDRGD